MNEGKTARKPRLKTVVSTTLFLLLLGLLAAYLVTHWDEMRGLLSLSPDVVVTLLLLGLFSAVVNSLYHLALLNTYGLRLSLVDWMGVVCVSNAIAYVLPMRADLVFSATYYKRVKGLAYVKSVSMGAGNIVFGVAFSLLQILIALLCMGLYDGAWPLSLWLITLAGAAMVLLFVWLSGHAESRLRGRLSKLKLVGDVLSGFNALVRNGGLLWRLLLCMVLSNLGKLITTMVCFRAVGVPVTLYEALFYSSVGWLASIVAIVPGNIGLKESVMGVATLMLGSLFSEGVAASLVDRVTIMMVYITLGLLFALPVWRNLSRAGGTLLPGKRGVPAADVAPVSCGAPQPAADAAPQTDGASPVR
jgi:uncharacterized membrane protein YbhN (UPF0104 family)